MRLDRNPSPTTDATAPSRLALLTTWMHLLQRQGYDTTGYAASIDRMQAARKAGGGGDFFAAIDAAIDGLDRIQTDGEPIQPMAGPGPDPRESQPGADWPVYGGDAQHHAGTDEPGPLEGRVAWTFPVGLAWYARPVVVQDRVYVPTPAIRSLLHCLDLQTGRVQWQTRRRWTWESLANSGINHSCYTTPGVASTPVVTAQRVFLNEYGGQGRDSAARCLTVVDRASGEMLKRFPAGNADYRAGHTPLVGDGRHLVYQDGTQRIQDSPPRCQGAVRLVCVEAVSGRECWRAHVGPMFAEPVLHGNDVLVGTHDGTVVCAHIEGASAEDTFGFSDRKRFAWFHAAGAAVNAPVAVTDERVWFGANDGCVTCLDRTTGEVVWRCRLEEPDPRAFAFFSRPLLHGNRLYVGSAGKQLHCLDAAGGEPLWSHTLPDWVRACPAVVGDTVLAAALDGSVHAVRDMGRRAETVWRVHVGRHMILADLVAAGDRVLVTTSDLRVVCLDCAGGSIVWEHFLLDQVDVDGTRYRADEFAGGGVYQSKPTAADGKVFVGTPSRFVHALNHATGKELWRCELGGAVSGSPAYADGRIFVGQQGGEEYLYGLDATTGMPLWRQTLGWVWSSANIAGGRLFVPTVDGHAACLDAATGRILWRYRTGRAAHPEPAIDGSQVFFGSWDHCVYAFDTETGRLLWQYHTGGTPDSGAPIAADGKVYIPMGGTRLACLDAATGGEIWVYQIERGCMNASPALWKGRLYISSSVRPAAVPVAARIRCLDALDGRVIWEHCGGGISAPVIADGRAYFGSTSDPFFRCVDAEGNGDGTTNCLWRLPSGDRVYESVPAIYGGHAYILNEDGHLYAYA